MLFSKVIKRSIPVIGLAAASLFGGESASATVSPAIAGKPWFPSEANCFQSAWAQISLTDACKNSPRKWLIPVPMTSGSHTFSATVHGGHPGALTCRVLINDHRNNLIWQSAAMTEAETDSNRRLNFGTRTVPAGASAHFDCDLWGIAGVYSVSY